MANLRVNKIAAVGVSTENTGSVFFDGTGDYLATEVSDDFALGTNDFTFEMWVYYESRSTGDTPAVLDSTTTTYAPLIGYIENDASTNGHAVVYISANGSSWGIASNKTFGLITAKQWYHLAISRSGSNFYLFKDGQLTDSFTSSSAIHQGANQIGFGRIQSSVYFDGYISNARLCNGHAVYTSNFTPPTRELEVHPETVFLGLYDGENIFSDKSGRHIIAAYGDRLSSPTPTATDSPIGITTFNPGLTRSVDATAGPTFQGGAGFVSQNWLTLPKGTTTDRNRTGGRGVFGGGENPSQNNVIQFVNMSSQGTSQDFGDLVRTQLDMGATGSQTRGLFAGGDATTAPLVDENTIQFITIATTGNAADFGDLTGRRKLVMGGGTNTRGVFGGGSEGSDHKNNIDYVTIASLGNAQDFGDLNKLPNQSERGASQVTGSPTRGIFYIKDNAISYITWATLGNALDFGDTINNSGGAGAVGDTTRSCMHGTTASYNNSIEYITISTLGNGQDFGDLTVAMRYQYGASNPTRGVMAGAADPALNNINFITIQTTGNAQDFGDLNTGQQRGIGLSDSHGGLG